MMNTSIYVVVCIFAHLGGYPVSADTVSLRERLSALNIDAVFPGDPNYKKFSTAYNRRFTYRPAAIVFPDNTNAVANLVKVGVEEKLLSKITSISFIDCQVLQVPYVS